MNPARHLAPMFAGLALVLAGIAVAAPLPAVENAASINAGLQAMRNYNLIALHDLTSTSEVQGRTFVGNNLSGGSSNYFTSPKGQTGTALTVVGDVTGGSKNINNGGDLKVGGNLDSGASMNGGGDVYVDGNVKKVNANGASIYAEGNVENSNAKDIYHGGTIKSSNGVKHAGDHSVSNLDTDLQAQAAAMADELLDVSDYLAGLAPTNTLTYSANGQDAIINAGVGTGVAVFSIADLGDALKKASQLKFTFPTTFDAVIVNVSGKTITLPTGINFNNGTSLGTKVIWNFYEATSINLANKSWYGTVLAPKADLRFNNFIEGTVIARNITQNGQAKMGNYAGGDLVDSLRTGVPEPASWMLMILGFGATGAMLRRRKLALAPVR